MNVIGANEGLGDDGRLDEDKGLNGRRSRVPGGEGPVGGNESVYLRLSDNWKDRPGRSTSRVSNGNQTVSLDKR